MQHPHDDMPKPLPTLSATNQPTPSKVDTADPVALPMVWTVITWCPPGVQSR